MVGMANIVNWTDEFKGVLFKRLELLLFHRIQQKNYWYLLVYKQGSFSNLKYVVISLKSFGDGTNLQKLDILISHPLQALSFEVLYMHRRDFIWKSTQYNEH